MKLAPDPKDVQEFQFKQSTTFQLFNGITNVPKGCNLLVADKKRGLLYIGHENKIIVFKPADESKPEWKIQFELSSTISKLSLSCDCTFLAVTPLKPVVLIYSVNALVQNNLELLYEIRVSSANAKVLVADIRWNPAVPEMLCTVATDHTVGSFQVKSEKEKILTLKALERLNGLDVTCAAWSPKGKQIVVGCKNGNIVQLKPDLKIARTIPSPAPYIGEVINILWISSYQFCAAYYSAEQRIDVLIVDAPKGEATASFTSYEDITYGILDAEGELPRYYFDHVPEWGLIIAASSGSSEIAVLGSVDGGTTWNQWQLIDSGRAQLPLIGTAESYPIGLAIDRTPINKLPWGADSTLPNPVPLLHILGTSGQLCSFHMVNLTPNCPAITSPPTEIVNPPSQPRPSIVPSELSFNLNNAATSTPRPKQVETTERPKAAPPGNIFGDSLKAAGFFHTTTDFSHESEQLKVQSEKPAIIKTEIKPKETSQQEVKTIVKTPVTETTVQETEEQKSTIDEEICIRAYMEELNLFEKELRNRLEIQTWECGTEEERKQLGERAAVIDQFLRDLKETTSSLSSEIVCLKALLLQSFAWVEETKSKNSSSADITTQAGGDNSKVAELQRLYYYTQSQLVHANRILDLEWSEHNSKKKMQMKIPSLEIVHQNLMLHYKIILKEKTRVEQLTKKWKSLVRKHDIVGLNRSLLNMQVTPQKSSNVRTNAGIIEARCKAVASKTLGFTHSKQVKLRNLLIESSPRVIKPVNPSPIQDRLEATLSSLASSGPVVTDIENRVLSKDVKSPLSKQTIEKPKAQSPLASLNSIVARIGSAEANNTGMQNKAQIKSPSVNTPISSTVINKPPIQPEMKNINVPTMPINAAQIKQKQDVKMYGQINGTATAPNLSKGFPSNSINFGISTKVPESLHQKSPPKESVRSEKESVDTTKNVSTLFPSLNDVLSFSLPKGLEVTCTSASTTSTAKDIKPDSTTPFSFASPNVSAATTKDFTSSPASAMPTIKQQTYFFASKTVNLVPFNSSKPTMFSGLPLGSQQTSGSNNNLNDGKSGVTIEEILTILPEGFNKLPPGTKPLALPAATTQNISSVPLNATTVVTSTVAPKTSSVPALPMPQAMTSPNSSFAFGGLQTTAPTSATPLFSTQSAASMFGGLSMTPSTTTPTTVSVTTPPFSTFGVSTPITTTSSILFGTQTVTTPTSVFSSFSASPSIAPSFNTATPSTTSVFPLSKPTFGSDTTTSQATSTFAGVSNTPVSTITFGSPTTPATAALTFGKTTTGPLNQNAQFPATTTPSTNVFSKPVLSPAAISFGSSSSTPVFSSMATPASTTSIFSGTNSGTIFGSTPTPSTTSASIFGGNTMTNFGTPSTGSIFDNTAKPVGLVFGTNSAPGSPSLFGGVATNTVAPPMESPSTFGTVVSSASSPTATGSPSVFGGSPGSSAMGGLGSPTGFGQAPTFGSKPVFGSSPPVFGTSKPVFGGGFGTPMFGTGAPSTGFGSPPQMASNPTPLGNDMSKVFGNTTGSSTFETLASQSGGLTFGSLAQKSPEPEKPVFTGGSSFSSWR